MSHVCIRLRCRNLGFLQILRKHPGDSSAKKKDSPTALAGGADPGTFTAPCAVGWVRNLA